MLNVGYNDFREKKNLCNSLLLMVIEFYFLKYNCFYGLVVIM